MFSKIKAALILSLLVSSLAYAQTYPPVLYPDGKLAPTGPSMPVGSRNSATDAVCMAESESTTGVCSLWVTTAGSSKIQICDAGGQCADVNAYAATFAAATVLGLQTVAGLYAFDAAGGANMVRLSAHAAGDGMAAAQVGLDALTYNLVYDATAGHWDRMRSDTNGALITNQSTTFPGYGRLQDGDSAVLTDVEDAIADGKALTLNGPVTNAMGYAYNGVSMDMLRNGAVRELQVTDVATRPGEDAANDWRKVRIQSIATYAPAKETTANIGTALVQVLASKEILGYPNCTLYYRNVGANILTNAEVFVSPDNAGVCGDGNWVNQAWAACDALAATTTCAYQIPDGSYRYLCAQAAAADANRTTIDAWVTCNAH